VPRSSGWHAQQIAEFLAAVSAYEDEAAALEGAVERAAEAMEAEVAAVVGGGAVLASVGFRAGNVPVDELVTLSAGRGAGAAVAESPLLGGPPVLHVPGVGYCATVAVPVDCTTTLLVARSGDPFASEEAAAAGPGPGAGPGAADAPGRRQRTGATA
jgi:hypothetical protein